MKEKLILKLLGISKIAKASKITRLLKNPVKYISAIYYWKMVYPKTKQEKIVTANLFFDTTMKVALPSSTDIYLVGGKSHSSEIRLAHFMIKNFNKGDSFLDIGAHCGYFTLLMAEIIGSKGKIISFEPTVKSFALLKENTLALPNITCYQKALSNVEEEIIFYEFPNLYAEYNTTDITQFEKESWFKTSAPNKVKVSATTIDNLLSGNNFQPNLIKLDVEGAEYKVLNGGLNYFKLNNPIIVMEYLEPKRKNAVHEAAHKLLESINYVAHIITQNGDLEVVEDVNHYLMTNKLESDNIVFVKKNLS